MNKTVEPIDPFDPNDYVPVSTPEADPWTIDLADIDMSYGPLFEAGVHHEYFKRLRRDDPVHYYEGNPVTGPFWSITKYKDVLAVDTNHKAFSSEPSIALIDNLMPGEVVPSFIAMDSPKHEHQRKVVTPAVTPLRLVDLDALIRERTVEVLDSLPVGEPFNWVDLVSIELTTRMLATLFDFPFEDRRKLTYWSDVATSPPVQMGITSEERAAHLFECLETFTGLFKERQDFISLMANHPDTKDLDGLGLLGNLLLLIVGGNDTTRNSMSGGVWFLQQNPGEFAKLKADQSLIPSMVAEIIRYQTPLSYMRRTALEDVEIGGKLIKKGDKVAMWYASANRDEDEIENADQFIVDRKNARHHIAFGFGIHRCMGNRVAEAQLRILWEEILKRFDRIEVIGKPERLSHSFVHGIKFLNVIAHPLK